jgi:hypothetical protein
MKARIVAAGVCHSPLNIMAKGDSLILAEIAVKTMLS